VHLNVQVVALDRTHAKAAKVQELADGLGITIVKAYKMDATRAVSLPARGRRTEAPRSRQQHDWDSEEEAAVGAAAAVAEEEEEEEAEAEAEAKKERRLQELEEERARSASQHALRLARKAAASMKMHGHAPPRPVAETTGAYAAESFDSVLLDAPCTALGLRPRLLLGDESMGNLK
jgi:16S rRNA C967 or C1407 C5-methylase (RsmB/RsmF family)